MQITTLKYFSPWFALFVLLALFGYPKIPYLGVPFAFIVFLLDFKNILRIYCSKLGQTHIFICATFLAFCCLRVFLGDGLYVERNLLFCFTLFYKALIGVYIACVFMYLILNKHLFLIFFMMMQFLLMGFSAFNETLYAFLLLFQTADATAVFGEIFGLRSVGFGVIHNEGVVALTLMYVLYLEIAQPSRLVASALGAFAYLSTFSSRLVLVLLPVWQVVKQRKLLAGCALLLVFLLPFLDVSQGPLSQAFELLNHYLETGVVGSQSTNALSGMTYAPDTLGTWVLGDGQFFSETGFYQETDIGFSRIVFFGGLAGLLLYTLLCCWPLLIFIKGWKRPLHRSVKTNWFICGFMMYVFFVSNVKGINIQTWSFIVYICVFKNMHAQMRGAKTL
jgi:hypothetical protein